MPMREECKNFESRTYANGETVRKCNLDLAPDARGAAPTPARATSAGWPTSTGPTARSSRRSSPDEPPGLDDGSAAAVLDEAEDIINAVGPEVLAEVQAKQRKKGWKRFRRK